jgi:PhnB protein
MAQLNPYLNFDNNCREAMNFYKDCLGGELSLQTVSESPVMAAQMPPQYKDSILHSSLTSGKMVIMASDMNREKPVDGNTIQLCINCDSEQELDSFFSKLSAGGTIIEPLADMPWGGRYGALTDRFGKHWLFNFQKVNPMS